MIWRPVPQVKPQPQVASPNILAFRLPADSAAPARPPRKLFVPPEPRRRKPPDPLLAAGAAKVQVQKQSPAMPASLVAAIENRPKPRNFVPPVPKPERRVAVQALPEAPGIATALRSERVPMLAENMAAALANKPQPRTFVPPPAPGRPSPHPLRCRMRRRSRCNSRAERWGRIRRSRMRRAALANKPSPRVCAAAMRGWRSRPERLRGCAAAGRSSHQWTPPACLHPT